MIKKIHYCWLGGKPLPSSVQSCLKSWKRSCPDYEIIRWDESSFPIDQYPWVKEAIRHRLYAFAADFIRLNVLYEYGGVYMDVDVELIKPIDCYLTSSFVSGFTNHHIHTHEMDYVSEDGYNMLTGKRYRWFQVQAGFMYSEAHHPFIEHCLTTLYENGQRAFVKSDGSYNIFTMDIMLIRMLEKYGIRYVDETQHLEPGITIYKSNIFATRKSLDRDSVLIHWFDQSWRRGGWKMKAKKIIKSRFYWLYRTANRFCYQKLRNVI